MKPILMFTLAFSIGLPVAAVHAADSAPWDAHPADRKSVV